MFGNEPNRFFARHPIQPIEARQIYRTRVVAQRPFKSQIEINIEVAHRQFAQCAINGLAITTASEIRFRNGAPMSADFENCDDVIGVLLGFQIEDERRKSKNAKRSRGKNRSFETRRRLFMENFFW